jgi:hypothetical protein
MPWEVNPLFHQWLYAHFPDRAQRVLNRMKDMRGGKEYDSDFGKRMTGEGIWADLIRQRFNKAVKRLGMDGFNGRFSKMDGAQFRRPLVVPSAAACQRRDEDVTQLDLFGAKSADGAAEGGGKPAGRKAKASPQLDLF